MERVEEFGPDHCPSEWGVTTSTTVFPRSRDGGVGDRREEEAWPWAVAAHEDLEDTARTTRSSKGKDLKVAQASQEAGWPKRRTGGEVREGHRHDQSGPTATVLFRTVKERGPQSDEDVGSVRSPTSKNGSSGPVLGEKHRAAQCRGGGSCCG